MNHTIYDKVDDLYIERWLLDAFVDFYVLQRVARTTNMQLIQIIWKIVVIETWWLCRDKHIYASTDAQMQRCTQARITHIPNAIQIHGNLTISQFNVTLDYAIIKFQMDVSRNIKYIHNVHI